MKIDFSEIYTMDKILFFDTETTGVPSNYLASLSDTSHWPRLVQLGWIVANADGSIISENSYVIYPDGFDIPIDSSSIHGITTDYARREGRNIADVLALFVQDLDKVNRIVGHNIKFDQYIVGAELCRLNWSYRQLFNLPTTCTMKKSIDFCKLLPFRYGEYKWPELEELYSRLFDGEYFDAHDAMADIEATKKCYFELIRRGIIADYQDEESKLEVTIPVEKITEQPQEQTTIKIIESGKCGDNVFYELTEEGVLNIFGSGKMYDYDLDLLYGEPNSPFYNKKIKKILIKELVTTIGTLVFSYCSSLLEVVISNSVIKIEKKHFIIANLLYL